MAQIRYEWRGQRNGDVVSLVVEDESSDAFLNKIRALVADGRFKELLPEKK